MRPMKITLMGAGACGFIGAAHCASMGHDVTLYELPEFAESLEAVREAGGIEVDATSGSGLPNGFVRLTRLTTDVSEALRGAEVVLVTVPSFGESRVARLCAGHLKGEQCVYLMSGYIYGSLEFIREMRENGHAGPIHIAEMNNTIYAGAKLSAGSVRAGGYKHNLGVAAFPGSETPAMVEKLRGIYPQVVPFANVVETGISNPNAALHPIAVLFNAPCVERGEEVLLYHDKKYPAAMSDAVCGVYETMDAERLSLRSLGAFASLKPWREIFRDWYAYNGARGRTLLEIMKSNPGLSRAKLPPSFDHRYVTEDVTAGLIPLIELLDRFGIPCPTNRAVVHLSSVLSGIDLQARGRTLGNLGLGHIANEKLLDYLHTGISA